MGKLYVLFFDEVTKDSIELVGGKGANLGELVKAGFPVPNGYCISVDAYKSIVGESDIQEKINKIIATVDWDKPSDIEEKSLPIRELIMSRPIPDKIKKEIINAYYKLTQVGQPNGAAVAVRSSATAEDLPDASFAGQQETYLNILGEHELLVHVTCCWASLWTARAMAYRHKQNYDHSKVYLSIIIQRMVEAEAAGVAFTANPLNGRMDEMIINSSYGLGEVVVAGIVTPDNFVLNRKTLEIKTRRLGSKEKQLQINFTGKTQQIDVPNDKRKEFSLSDAQLRELGEVANRVEEHYRVPQDIEWAFAKGKIYLLQARPVTALGSEVNDDNLLIGKLTKIQKFMLDDLIEHYPEAPTPLDHAVVTTSYQAILNSADNLGIKISRAKEIISLENDGRITLVPPKIKYSLRLLSVPAKLFKATKISQAQWRKEYQQISQTINQWEETNMAAETDEQLAIYLQDVFHLAEKICCLRFYNFFEANLLPLVVISLVLKVFCSKKNRPPLMDLMTTGLDYKTAIIDREINGLAVAANLEPQLYAIIMGDGEVKFENIKNQLLHITGGREFLGKLEDFLKAYGYRTEKMYQPFTSKSWLESPDLLMVIIRAALQDPQLTERKHNELKRKKEHEIWVNNFESKLTGPFKRLFRWSYNSLRTNHIIREETLFNLEKIFTTGRKIKDELGNRLTDAGYLKAAEDIVYLTKEEICHGIIAQIEKDKCQRLVSIRKKNFSLNQTLWVKTLLKLVEYKKDVDALQGISGSPGFVEGPAQIIMSLHDFNKLKKGDILFCPYTDPTWTSLFGMAAAVVADTGGPLSHAAIVAREYGIPAVLGTKIGTSYINAGEIVVVDGSAGIVYKSECDFKKAKTKQS